MASDGWATGHLGDIAEVVMGTSPPGSTCNDSGVGIPLLNGPTEFGEHYPEPVQFTTQPVKKCQPNDILFCVRGSTTGRMNWADREYAIGRGLAAIRHRADIRCRQYVKGAIDYGLPSLLAVSSGSTFPSVSRPDIEGMEISIPPPKEQRAIACVLGALDDKIELNRKMNATLEGIARAIFKSWFVDFDPVRAKAAVRRQHPKWTNEQVSRAACPNLRPDLAALFPDSFQDSELGEIPKGWEVKPLDEIAHFQNGLALQKYRPKDREGRLPVVKIAQLRSGSADSGEWATTNLKPECIIDDGDVVFSWSGSLLVRVWTGGPAALNQHLFKVTSDKCPRWFFLDAILSHLPDFRRIAADKATTMGHIQRHHLTSAMCVVPDETFLRTVSPLFSSLLDRSVANEVQCRTLGTLRDTLLPKLISGELRVPDAERIVGRAV